MKVSSYISANTLNNNAKADSNNFRREKSGYNERAIVTAIKIKAAYKTVNRTEPEFSTR